MGCGSSSTAVKAFNDQENRDHRHKQEAAKVRRASASSRSSKSSSSSDSSKGSSRHKHKKLSSASSRNKHDKVLTIALKTEDNGTNITQTEINDVKHSNEVTETVPVNDHKWEEDSKIKHESASLDVDVTAVTSGKTHQQELVEVEKKAPVPPKQIKEVNNIAAESDGPEILTEDPLKRRGDFIDEGRAQRHETIALEKAEKRDKFDFDVIEEARIAGLGSFSPIDMNGLQQVDQSSLPWINSDDMEKHNQSNPGDWFKYGRNVYSNYKFWPVVQNRVTEHFKIVEMIEGGDGETMTDIKLPVQKASEHGVPRRTIRFILQCCKVGRWEDLPLETYLERMKLSADNVVEEIQLGDIDMVYVDDYKQQISRWLAVFPNVKRENKLDDYKVDPNEIEFPLPAEIKSSPNELRRFIESYEPFDTSDGALALREVQYDKLDDTHEFFAKLVAEDHTDDTLDDLDMAIEGEAGWDVVQVELFKNDVTTEKQNEVWKLRALRTTLENPDWMRKRRHALAMSLTKRHEWEPNVTEPYLQFCERLETGWKQFQELCQKEFVPPKRRTVDDDQMPESNSTNAKSERLQQSSDKEKSTPDGEHLGENNNGQIVGRRVSGDSSNENLNLRDNNVGAGRPKSDSTLGSRAQEPTIDSMDSGLDMISGETLDSDRKNA